MAELPPEMLAKIRDSFARQGLMTTLQATMDAAGEGTVRLSCPIRAAISQQHGFAHAGATFALGDSAAGYAALTRLPAEGEVVTVEMKVNLLAPATGHTLIAEGRVIRAGRRVVVVTAEVFAEAETGRRQVALMQGTMMPT